MGITVPGTRTGQSDTNSQRAPRRGQQEPTMTATFTRTLRKAVLALTIATTLGAMTSTQSFAYSAEAQQQCTGDAFRLCSSEIPNIPAITACMVKNRSSLSSGCRAVLDREVSGRSGKIAATTEAN